METPARPRTLAVLGVLAALALSGAACGDDETTSTAPAAGGTSPAAGGNGATSTDLEPGSGGTVPDLPVNDDLTAVQCTGPPEEVFDATTIVGEPLGAARDAARAAGCEVRVVIRDGEPLAVTEDFRPDRIDVVVTDGNVEKIDGLY